MKEDIIGIETNRWREGKWSTLGAGIEAIAEIITIVIIYKVMFSQYNRIEDVDTVKAIYPTNRHIIR